ncbi:MAG TPA: hypothetical protein VFG83_19585, partial [Kofleriaceae bacterium]|nr:hypothetical protein [Kofleriaceae bacterium]
MIRCFLLLPVIAACAPGCSFIYDPADLTSADDGPVAIDASVDGNDASVVDSFPLPDVDPGILDIFKVSPPALFEAAGSVRPVPVVLRGQNLGPDATFTITGADGIEVVDGWQASGDGHYAAFSVKVPVVTGCDGGDMPLTITVTDGDEMTTAELMLTCLPELSLSGSYSTDDSPAGPLLFSTIDVTGDVVVTGANPLRLVATGPITVAGIIHADGSGQSAGPGGCAGAPKNADGGCGAGGGRNGAGNAGGGGGGHGTAAA